MYRILIVEDEHSIREGLKSLDWSSVGIEIAGTAENGLTALFFLQSNPVDIMLTDIRMPIIDGIQLASMVNRDYPSVKVVVLTVHNDFEHVRSCLRTGVVDYFVKPVESRELLESCGGIASNLDREKSRHESMRRLDWKVGPRLGHLRKVFLDELLTEARSIEDASEQADYCEMILETGPFTVACLMSDLPALNLQRSRDQGCLALFGMDRIVADCIEQKGIGYHTIDADPLRIRILLTDPGLQEDRDALRSMLVSVRERLYKLNSLVRSSYAWGIGLPAAGLADLPRSAREAERMLQQRHEPNSILFHPAGSGAFESEEEHLLEAETAGPSIRPGADMQPDNLLISKAIDHIQQHFMEHLSLADIAKPLYIHPGYLSTLFKGITGRNFSSYLTDLRVSKAKELLRDATVKVAEAGRRVGYEDPAYFARVFKQVAAMTPIDFRNRIHPESEAP